MSSYKYITHIISLKLVPFGCSKETQLQYETFFNSLTFIFISDLIFETTKNVESVGLQVESTDFGV